VELVEETVHMPSPTLEAAVAANEERSAKMYHALALYSNLKAEASVAGELDELLEYSGVNIALFTRPLAADDASAAS
jgi:hypothetical protein